MDAATLSRAMGCSRAVADRYVAAFNAALLQAGCTTVNRCAMWTAQTGHETGSLRHMREIWGPTAQQRKYDPASGSKLSRDLGNTRVGDGKLYMGHGAIMVTGKANHAAVSRWAHTKGYVPTPTHFVDHPDELAGDRFGFLGAVWYWTVARPRLNAQSDARDLVAATRSINGGTNGLADRRNRWNRCLQLGNALLPTGGAAPVHEEEPDLDAEQNRMLWELYKQLVEGTGNSRDVKSWGWPSWQGGTGERLTTTDRLRRIEVEVRQARNQLAKMQAELDQFKGR